jgi:hypothetical protein
MCSHLCAAKMPATKLLMRRCSFTMSSAFRLAEAREAIPTSPITFKLALILLRHGQQWQTFACHHRQRSVIWTSTGIHMKRIVAIAALLATSTGSVESKEIDVVFSEDDARVTLETESVNWVFSNKAGRLVSAYTFLYDGSGRIRSYVTVGSCKQGYGPMVLTTFPTKETRTANWRTGGGRVYDKLAETLCALDQQGSSRKLDDLQ